MNSKEMAEKMALDIGRKSYSDPYKHYEIQRILTAYSPLEQLLEVARCAEDSLRPLRQLAALANVNDETRKMIIHIGNGLNEALEKLKQKGVGV